MKSLQLSPTANATGKSWLRPRTSVPCWRIATASFYAGISGVQAERPLRKTRTRDTLCGFEIRGLCHFRAGQLSLRKTGALSTCHLDGNTGEYRSLPGANFCFAEISPPPGL